MKIIKSIFLIFISIVILPDFVNAESCSNDDRQKIYMLINNIKITYTHTGNNMFDINIYNIPEQIYLVDPSNKKHYHTSDNSASISSGFLGGKTYRLEIYSTNNDNCVDEMKYTKSIYINKYNLYSEKDICKNNKYSNFKYCNKDYQGVINDEIFERELKKYDETLVIEDEPKKTDNNLIDNIYLIAGGIAGVIVLIVIVTIIKRKKKRRIRI